MRPIDKTLNGITKSALSGPGSNGNDDYSPFLKAPELEIYHQMVESYPGHLLVEMGSYSSAEM